MAIARSLKPRLFTLPTRAAPRASLRGNFLWTLAGNVIAAAAQWALIVLLARLGSPEMVGQYTLGLAVAAPIFTFASLHLRGLQATDMSAQFRFCDYLGIRLASAALAILATMLVLVCGSYSWETSLVITGVALTKAIDAVSETVYGRWHQREQMERIARSMILRGLVSVASLSALVWWQRSAVWGVGGLALVSLVVLLSYDLRRLDAARARLPDLASLRAKMWALARVAGPLGFLPMLVSLNGSQPRYWLAHQRSEIEVGLYSALACIAIAANVVVMALAQAAGPAMTRAYDAGDHKEFLRQALRLAAVGLALGVCGILAAWLWGAPIVALCYGPRYAEHSATLVWLMIGGAFSYVASCAGYTLTSARRFLAQLPILCVVAVVIAAVSSALIPVRGIEGAAIAHAAGSGVQLVLSVAMLAWMFRR